MSLTGINTSTDRLRDLVLTEKARGTPQIDLVKRKREYTRAYMSQAYSTDPMVIEKLANTFLHFLNSTKETNGWYDVWKNGNQATNDEFWHNVQNIFVKDPSFVKMTSKFSKKIPALTGRGIFYTSNT